MKIAIIGTGYVGLPTGVGLAELGNDVVCIDRELSKIERLKAGHITLFEEGLEELFNKNLHEGRITFTTSMKEGIEKADIVIIAVGTPPHPVTKEADMKYIHAAATELADYLQDYTVIATKSTVPVGTGDDIECLISKRNPNANFDVISLPEFLREGFAVYDFFNPDRIIVGANSKRAISIISELYAPFDDKTEILFVSRRSSETIKYASNSFLAIKIHYINEMANFCEKAGADIREVAAGMGLDTRIGNKFLNAGPGYGGSCFPKDTNAMAYMGRQNDINLSLVEAAIQGNHQRKKEMAHKIINAIKVNKAKPRIAALGLAFKGGTDDCRESPAVEIIEELLNLNADVIAYDPKALNNVKDLLGDKIEYANSAYDAMCGADILVILTEWDEFKLLDLDKVKSLLKHNIIIDLRNVLSAEDVVKADLQYLGIGYQV
ncbi:UDP-glucose dehydrogenase family protein [Orbus sturtevantii]|uniref:UDP-glucose dehydrogenase family protein n=1 Tax=Orbus sturtevantii TaxID=3074109 RepID=UPI00370DC19D